MRIPDTSITIRLIETGPREGEFLFSAGTVEGLERMYNRARDLPYKPGATVGIYSEFARTSAESHAADDHKERVGYVEVGRIKTLCLKVGVEPCSKNPYFRVTVAFVVV